jgi:non-heme chloroperoxidase
MKSIIHTLQMTAFAAVLTISCVSGWAQDKPEAQKPMMVAGGGGTKIAVYEYGDPNGPEILLVHGFSQSHLSWSKQYNSPMMQKFRMVAIDLRGHGASEKPTNAESYDNSKVWADDINAVIKAKNLKKPIIVGWSYGGFIISDYVREFGDSNLGGIDFVGAATQLGTEDAKSQFGPGLEPVGRMLDPRQEVNIPATAQFLRLTTAAPLPSEEFEQAFAYNMAVSPEVRLGLLSRKIDGNDALAKITVPVLVSHGQKDIMVLVASGDYIASKIKQAQKSYYPDAGHIPFMEDPERFNRELAELASKVGR